MESCWSELAALKHKAKASACGAVSPRAQRHLIPVRMIPIEIIVPIIGMVPSIITSVPVISARIFAINPDRNPGRVSWLDHTTRCTEQSYQTK